MPRVFEIACSHGKMTVVTYYWALYCPVKEGDEVEITGVLHQNNNLISIDDNQNGIKIIK